VRGPAHTRAARLLTPVAAALAACVAAAGTSAATPGQTRAEAEALRGNATGLAALERSALLDLYSIETRLGRSRSSLAGLRTRLAALRKEETSARTRLQIAQRALASSQAALGKELRSLYEQGDPNAIAVLLGAESLDDAITELDTIDRAARDHSRIIEQTTKAQARTRALAKELDRRRTLLRSAEASVRRTTSALEAARGERTTYIRRLRTQRQLTASRISALEAQAAEAERKSRELAAAAAERARQEAAARAAAAGAPRTASGAPAVDVPNAEIPEGATLPDHGAPAPAGVAGRAVTVTATAYTIRGRTATGLPTGWGIVAVDPSFIPLGTKMTIPGYGEAIAADTGSAVRGAKIDVWVPDLDSALAFGRRTITIVLH
jgi:3D (Asp-Asp-Asp) domain-containing protein/peptidoglycan hydrolase CwlO-like protein